MEPHTTSAFSATSGKLHELQYTDDQHIVQAQRAETWEDILSAQQYFTDMNKEMFEIIEGWSTTSSLCASYLDEGELAESYAKYELANNPNPLKQIRAHIALAAVIVPLVKRKRQA